MNYFLGIDPYPSKATAGTGSSEKGKAGISKGSRGRPGREDSLQ
jgi:hypothetical protein